ncbi:MAG: ABC transporter permease [Chloroflexota bacterium]
MNAPRNRWIENARLVWAITAKDLLEALRNKNTLSAIISALFVVVMYRFIPSLESHGAPPNLLIYDAGDSALVALLENSPAVEVYTYTSEKKMKRVLTDGDFPELGLVIPAGFDQALEAGEAAPELQGYVVNWVSQADAWQLRDQVQAEITRLLGQPASVRLGDPVPLQPDSDGLGNWAALSIIFVGIMIGASFVPHLFLEEKQSRTLDALLVSPAGAAHVVAAKAITGLVYGLLGAGVGLAFYASLIVHWGLALLTILLVLLFAISLGLSLGVVIENRGQLTLWAWFLIAPLFIPIILSLLAELLPEAVVQVSRAIPSVVGFNLLRASFAGSFSLGAVLLQLAWVAACTALALAGVVWLVARRDRAREAVWLPWLSAGLARLRSRLPARSPQAHIDVQPKERPQVQSPVDSSLMTTPSGLRLVWAIAAKDIREALRNRVALSIILGVSIMAAWNTIFPLLLPLNDKPTAVVYDQGRSTLVRGLTGREDYRLGIVDSQEEMQRAVSEAQEVRLGLVLPADFDQLAGGSQPIQLQAYAAHWADPQLVQRWLGVFEEQLGRATWSTVQINLLPPLYPLSDARGYVSMIATLIVTMLLSIGMALVSLLMVEEKDTHTLAALLVSPVRFSHLVIGKALAGSFYCLLAALVVVLFNLRFFVHWDVLLLALLLGAAFAVAVGLLVGMFSDSPTTTGMWAALALLTLIVPPVVYLIAGNRLPDGLHSLLAWQPGSLMMDLYLFSMAGNVSPGQVSQSALALAGLAGLLLALVAWLARRLERA